MSFMFEVYYSAPKDPAREVRIANLCRARGGEITYREDADESSVSQSICLTCEFASVDAANEVANQLRDLHEHVEGPVDYGD